MNGYSAYRQAAQRDEGGKSTEYRLFGQVTGALMDAQAALKEADPRNRLPAVRAKVDAILWNRELWATLKLDLLSPKNGLAEEIKASLVSLALFVERESTELLSGGDDLSALIDINRSIMDGLRPG